MRIRSLVKNMGDEKKPWHDVPIEILIEEEEKRRILEEELKRPRMEMPIYDAPMTGSDLTNSINPDEDTDDEPEDWKVVIKLL